MGILDKIKGMLGEHDDKVDQALDEAGDAGKERFAGQAGLIEGLVDKAKAATGEGDTTANGETPTEDTPAESPQVSEDAVSPRSGEPPV